jgi:[ribosomal protein S5]-alanine N-acetyltransferase
MRRLTTQNLSLEPQVASHAEAMFVVLSDPAIYEFENVPPESAKWLRERFTRLEPRGSADGTQQWLNWVVRRPTSELIGYLQATIHMPNEHERTAEIAYEFHSAYWGRGLASEAVRAMIEELSQYDVTHLAATLKRGNHRSTRLLERLGFAHASVQTHVQREMDADEKRMVRQVVAVL